MSRQTPQLGTSLPTAKLTAKFGAMVLMQIGDGIKRRERSQAFELARSPNSVPWKCESAKLEDCHLTTAVVLDKVGLITGGASKWATGGAQARRGDVARLTFYDEGAEPADAAYGTVDG